MIVLKLKLKKLKAKLNVWNRDVFDNVKKSGVK